MSKRLGKYSLIVEYHFTEENGDVEIQDEQPSSHRLAKSMGVDARNMQVMKASFFTEDDAPSGLGM